MILVIGGAGYIGSHMLKVLRESNEPHLVFDNFETGHRQALQGSRFVEGDLRKPADIRAAIEANGVHTVMHFGAYIMVGESVQKPAEYYENNFVGVMNLLQAMRDCGVLQLVFSSTAAVFGEPQYVPIDEDHPKDPTSPYGDTKLAVERLLAAYDRAYGLRSVCLRYFNAAGADPEGVLGEDHDPETHLIPATILAAMGKTPGLKLFGTDYDTPDGTCVRDYVHVMDLAQAHLMALRHLNAGGESRQYNLGNGKGFSVREVIDTVAAVMGRDVPQELAPRRAGDPATLIASSDRIRTDWGWSPKYPELATIVAHAWAWRERNPNGYPVD
jgi:UDP-glucose 4-epimerase